MTALDRIPSMGGPGATSKRRRPRYTPAARAGTRYAMPRRRLFQTATVAGFTVMGVFPAARAAFADGYDIYDGPCPDYASEHDCSPGCGPSPIFGGACEVDGEHLGFHRNDGVNWTLRPNQCYSGSYDGWVWKYADACGACSCSVERRCHDGYRNTGSGWVRSICRWNTECGCPSTVTWPVVAEGATGPDVTAVQWLLVKTGADIEADGIFGPLTESAVRTFQRDNGIDQTGEVAARTWASLVVQTERGDLGDQVTALQVELNKHGHRLEVDGNFGVLTDAAVQDFQRQNGLVVDGIAGQNTWRTLAGGAV